MEKENELKNKTVQTYAEDMAKVIQGDKEGLIKKIIHGEEEAEKEKKNLSPESKKNQFFMFAGIVLFLVALGVFSFFFFSQTNNTVPVTEQFAPFIFNDKTAFIEVAGLNKDKIAQSVRNGVINTKVKSGGVEAIYLTNNKKIASFPDFISLIKAELNQADINLIDKNFLMGAVNRESRDFFILLKVLSITDVFNPLRNWENKMFSDLNGFFGVGISAETKYLLTKNFEDGIIENKNARILYDQDNKIVMMYVFANDTSVIITDSENATNEIILRLASSQIKK